MELEPPVKLSTGEVYERLREQILDNTIPPATRVNTDAVSRQLGVSATPVREALHRLQGDNLVIATSGLGYRTTALLDLNGLRDLFEFRLLVEPWAARAAATNRLENPAHRLGVELDTFAALAVAKSDIRRDLVTHDGRFHDLIISATGNNVLAKAYSQTHCHLHIFRLYPADIDGAITADEHRKVWEAIRDCDPARAETAMHRHLTNAYLRFAMAFDGADPGLARFSAGSPKKTSIDTQIPAEAQANSRQSSSPNFTNGVD